MSTVALPIFSVIVKGSRKVMSTYNYEEIVQYLLNIPKFSSKNEASHTKSLLERLGSPQEVFSIIHVAGTNGKGSVCAYVNSVLCTAGKRVGMFTSPHLVRINERFRIQGEPVEDEKIVMAFEKVKPVMDAMVEEKLAHPTFFETMLAMGMVIFKEAGVEWLLLETGMGGRKDATNVVTPKLTAITSIGMDHMEYLGDTLEKIAEEKAGIIKEGIPVVFAEGAEETNRVICQKAEKMHAPAYPVSRKQVKTLKKGNKTIAFFAENRYYESVYLTLSTIGDYQVENALVAHKLLELIEEEISKEAYETGFGQAHWPGRMEEVLPGVYLDGAHNEPGVRAFLSTLEERPKRGRRILLFAVIGDKAYPEMIRDICEKGGFDCIVVTQIGGPRAADGAKVAELFRKGMDANSAVAALGGSPEENPDAFFGEGNTEAKVEFIKDTENAWHKVLREKTAQDEVYCAGSLYFIGAIKAILNKERKR